MARLATADRIASTRTNSILHNGNFAIRPSVLTASNVAGRWIDGTAGGSQSKSAYGWALISLTPNAEAGFDTSIFRNGTASMRLSTLSTAGAVTVSSYRTNPPVASSLFELFPLVPNASYTLSGYVRTNNVAANGAFLELREFTPSGGTVFSAVSNKLSGTDTSWRNVTLTITTGAATRFGGIFLRNNVPGNISDAWFADLTLIPASLGRVPQTGRIAI